MRLSRASGVNLAVFAWFAAVGCGGESHVVMHVPIASEFPLVFSPVYSAYDGVHDFRVPVAPEDDTVVDRWEVVDVDGTPRNDAVEISDDPQFGGVIMKMRTAGDFIVLAHSGQKTGCSELHVTAAQADRWTIGEARYQEVYTPTKNEPAQAKGQNTPPEMFACLNCHGLGDEALAPDYTPLQSGGFSDDALADLWTSGTRPSDQPLPPFRFCKPTWQTWTDRPPRDVVAWFHATSFTAQESSALILYMRSLPLLSRGDLDLDGVLPRDSMPID
jgi:hypothetical protein